MIVCFSFLCFLVHVSVLVSSDRYATRLAVADFPVPHAQNHTRNILLARVRHRTNRFRPHTVLYYVQPQAHRNNALLQRVSVHTIIYFNLLHVSRTVFSPRVSHGLLYFTDDHFSPRVHLSRPFSLSLRVHVYVYMHALCFFVLFSQNYLYNLQMK